MNENNTYLKSLKEILPGDCYETKGSRPVRVFCSDWNEYVCKYNTGFGTATSLFNEYLAASFLKFWGLKVPDYSFINVQKHHLNQLFPFHYFKMPCFGSLYNANFKEVDNLFLTLHFKNEHLEKLLYQYLKIGLFDIWLCNEDRNHNNMNLGYDIESVDFVPIDHVQIFNGNNIDKEPYQISNNESMLTAPFLHGIFLRPLQQNIATLRINIIADFYRDVSLCHESLDKILQLVPPEWGIDSFSINSQIEQYFSKEWQEKSLSTFFTFIQYALNRKP